jgi:hypothetical protein
MVFLMYHSAQQFYNRQIDNGIQTIKLSHYSDSQLPEDECTTISQNFIIRYISDDRQHTT